MKPRRVLVVEDDVVIRETLCELLSDTYRALGVGTLEAAQGEIVRDAPACIVLDLNLPDGSGERLLALLLSRGHSIPTVLVSAALAASRVAGRFGIALIPKPIDFDHLLAAVALAIEMPVIPRDGGA